jgi:hypothetical protein
LWSWRRGPLAFYAREAAAASRSLLPATGGAPSSADSPAALAASYTVTAIPPEAFAGEPVAVSVEARNTGHAVWQAWAPGAHGEVRLGWRWSRDGVDVLAGRAPLSQDVAPGETAWFDARIAPPPVPGDYVLTVDLVSELVAWFADGGQPAARAAVRVQRLEIERWLASPVVGTGPTVAIAADRRAYRRSDTLGLTVQARNPTYPSPKFDVYVVRQGPDGATSFYDGRGVRAPEGAAWSALVRALPMPALVVGRFALPLADAAPGAYRWHVILTDAGMYRPLARATAAVTVEP